ncbi:MAG: hypothetical protein MUF84_17730 [Anaerolineae bacterium]|jgi:hypothetical protein|nr:hypothetical protein [Anaerolineae bacterium]
MFEAIVFLAGAVLFFLAVIYFVILWQDRVALSRRHKQLQVELAEIKGQRIDLEIRERELQVWAEGLDHQQHAIAKAEEELRMLTAPKRPLDEPTSLRSSGGPQATGPTVGDGSRRDADGRIHAPDKARVARKNAKRAAAGQKLSS